MIAESGLAALWLATAMAALQAMGLSSILGSLQRYLAGVGAMLAVLSLLLLLTAFWRNDLSVQLVAREGAAFATAPQLAAAMLGTAAGRMFAFLVAVALAGAVAARFEHRLGQAGLRLVLGQIGIVQALLGAIVLLWFEPFARLDPPSPISSGLAVLVSGWTDVVAGSATPAGFACLVVAGAIAVAKRAGGLSGSDFGRATAVWALSGEVGLSAGVAASWAVPGPGDPIVLFGWCLSCLWLAAPTVRTWRHLPSSESLRFHLIRWGTITATLGALVMAGGITIAHSLSVDQRKSLQIGQTEETVAGQVRLVSVRPTAGPGWTALLASVALGEDAEATLHPQLRTLSNRAGQFGLPDLAHSAGKTVRLALGEPSADFSTYDIDLTIYPLAWLIPLGGWLAVTGGAMALAGRLASDIRRAVALEKIEWRRYRQGR